MMQVFTLLVVGLAVSVSALNPERKLQENKKICAIANIAEGGFTGITIGQVLFTQDSKDAPVHISGNIHSLTPGKHGFHIHQYGTTEDGCVLARGHFNPFSVTHGARQSLERHVGDLGNILANAHGVADFSFSDEIINLHSGSMENIIGRAVVVHAGEDDLGQGDTVASFKTGNAGGRVGCGVVAVTSCTAKLQKSEALYAMASLYKDSMSAKGVVTFSQESPSSPVVVKGSVTFFEQYSSNLHGFHIHEFGDTSDACKAAGGHFNPEGVPHGGPTDPVRHVGDLGNVQAVNNTSQFCIVDTMISLYPGVNSIVGRAVVVHQNEDDLGKGGDEGSAASGNAGPRLTCGTVGYVDKDYLKRTIPHSYCMH